MSNNGNSNDSCLLSIVVCAVFITVGFIVFYQHNKPDTNYNSDSTIQSYWDHKRQEYERAKRERLRQQQLIEYQKDFKIYGNNPIITAPSHTTRSRSTTPDDAYDEGYEAGYEQGRSDGLNGRYQGYGYDDSSSYYDYYEEKYQEGYEDGYYEGYTGGHSEYEDESAYEEEDEYE